MSLLFVGVDERNGFGWGLTNIRVTNYGIGHPTEEQPHCYDGDVKGREEGRVSRPTLLDFWLLVDRCCLHKN